MFKFRDDSYIEGQLDLCNTVNDKYPALTEFFDSEKGYDIVDYNRRSTTSIEKVVYEAGNPTDYHTPYKDVATYWRIRGCHKGSEAILHKFHYTNDTGKTGKVYITVYDHFQNNALDYCDWYGDWHPNSMGVGIDFWYDSDIDVRIRAYRNYGSTTRMETRTREVTDTIPVMTRQKHYVYWYDDDNDIINVNVSPSSGYSEGSSSGVIHSDSSNNESQKSSGSSNIGGIYYDPTLNGGYMGGESVSSGSSHGSWEDGGWNSPPWEASSYEGHTLYSDSKGKYYWEEVWTTKTITRTETYPVWITSGDDYFTRDCPDNQVYTFFFCTLNPGDTLDVWLEGEDSDAVPDPASYLRVEIAFDGSYVEVSPEVQEKPDGNKVEADGFANDMNFDWGRQEVVSGLANNMQFGWSADLTNDGTATDMQWRQI